MLFGDDDDLDTVKVDFLESFLKDNRIPDGYLTRQERGLPLLLSESDTVANTVRAFFNASIEQALVGDSSQ